MTAIDVQFAQGAAGSEPWPVDDGHPDPQTDALTNAQLRAAPVPVSGTVAVSGEVEVKNDVGNPLAVTVTNLPGTQPVSGTVAVSNLPATQPVTGPLTDAQLRATAVPVSVGEVEVKNDSGNPLAVAGTVAVSNFPASVEVANDSGNPLPVSGTVNVGNLPASQAVTGPLTDTQLRATPVPVSLGEVEVKNDSGNPLAVSGTVTEASAAGIKTDLDNRYGGGLTSTGAVLNTPGDNVFITPPAGKAVRIYWVSIVPNSDNSAANLVTVKFSTSSITPYIGYAVAHWEMFTGAANEVLTINLANNQAVAVTVHWKAI